MQDQIDALMQRVEELENRKPTPGPQGKPGNIAAAIVNAEEVAEKIVRESDARHLARIDSLTKEVIGLQQVVKDQEKRFEKVVSECTERFREGLENQVVVQILGLLQEYHLLNSDNSPSIYADCSDQRNRGGYNNGKQ